MCFLDRWFGVSGKERPSPQNWLPREAIHIVNNSIMINLFKLKVPIENPLVWIPSIPNTNSMDGVFDTGNNNLLIAGSNKDDHKKLTQHLAVGDVAVYHIEGKRPVIHRIVEINQDEKGLYFIFKGDNNTVKDKPRVRESEVTYVSVGTIY